MNDTHMDARKPLDIEEILNASTHVLDEFGIEGFSMRKLARHLGVDPMATYHHVKNRQTLMTLLIDRMFSNLPYPETSGFWRADVLQLCRSFREHSLAHPGVFAAYYWNEEWTVEEVKFNEALFESLLRSGVSAVLCARLVRLLIANVETLLYAELFEADDQFMQEFFSEGSTNPISTDSLYMQTLKNEEELMDFDAHFETCMEIVLDGITHSTREMAAQT